MQIVLASAEETFRENGCFSHLFLPRAPAP